MRWAAFQFQTGSIKSQENAVVNGKRKRFNSKLVRLKVSDGDVGNSNKYTVSIPNWFD